jgi:predicted O-methyltransferase YrrM
VRNIFQSEIDWNMLSIPKQIVNKAAFGWRFLRARRNVPQLYAQADGVSRTLLGTLDSTLQLDVTPEENSLIQEIEALRRELNASDRVITRTLYGLPTEYPHPVGEQVGDNRIVTETIGQACRRASRQQLWCLLLFKLIRTFRPTVCLELGTSLGITACYQAAALQLNQSGRLITLEGDETLASLAERHLKRLGFDNATVVRGKFEDTLTEVLNQHRPINYVFFDGDKRKGMLLQYFEQVCPFLADKAVVVFDDIYWSKVLEESWEVLEADNRIKVSIDTLALAVCLVDDNLDRKETFRVPLG